MFELTVGTASEKDEIVEFLNYVFSYSHAPHEFKLLHPKAYADEVDGLGAIHYMVKKDGRIRAIVADRIIDVAVGANVLKIGLIGNVSVHPAARGEGHMKTLMRTALDDARKRGVDLMLLGGQRQRYGYFGFENAGTDMHYTLSKANVRHALDAVDCSRIRFLPLTEEYVDACLALYESRIVHTKRAREEFLRIMRTWNMDTRVIFKGEEVIGYIYASGGELVLSDEGDLYAVIKALFAEDKLDELRLAASPIQKERAALLSAICESSAVAQVEMLCVLSWERVLKAYLELKSTLVPLLDGTLELKIDEGCYRIEVKNGVPSVLPLSEVGEDALCLSHNEAERKFFTMDAFTFPDERLKNWAPLPFSLDGPDGF